MQPVRQQCGDSFRVSVYTVEQVACACARRVGVEVDLVVAAGAPPLQAGVEADGERQGAAVTQRLRNGPRHRHRRQRPEAQLQPAVVRVDAALRIAAIRNRGAAETAVVQPHEEVLRRHVPLAGRLSEAHGDGPAHTGRELHLGAEDGAVPLLSLGARIVHLLRHRTQAPATAAPVADHAADASAEASENALYLLCHTYINATCAILLPIKVNLYLGHVWRRYS